MGTEIDHPAKQVTDAQLKTALQNICDQSGQPIARAKDIAEHESIPVKKSAVNKRLDPMVESGELARLQSGSGAVYWLPDDGEGGEVNPDLLSGDIINWESADPARVPSQFLQEAIVEAELSDVEDYVQSHPEYEEITRWDEYNRRGSDVINIGAPLFFVGLFIIVLNQSNFSSAIPFSVNVPSWMFLFGSLAFLGGAFIIFAAAVVVSIARVGPAFEDLTAATWIGTRWRRVQERVSETIPARLSRD